MDRRRFALALPAGLFLGSYQAAASPKIPRPNAHSRTHTGTLVMSKKPAAPAPAPNAPARDGEIAIREEYDLALQKNTAEALELFIARHPDHPLAQEAQQRLDEMTGQ